MISLNFNPNDPSRWGSFATAEEAKTLTSILQSVAQIACRENAVSVEVTHELFGSNSADDGEEEDLLWAEGMLAGPWMAKALSEYGDVLMSKRVDARVAAGEHWFDAFNAEFAAE